MDVELLFRFLGDEVFGWFYYFLWERKKVDSSDLNLMDIEVEKEDGKAGIESEE